MEIVMEMFWCILAALGAGVGTGLEIGRAHV